jgi:DNA polymerase zeta
VTPNKVAFVRKSVREGIIPRILLEFLMSRIMIKDSAKLYNDDTIKRLLNERQIAIKLFMNVMFGYTGASFSGRMPSSEIADSVVELARYLLTSSIEDIDGNPKYGRGKVVYGDTDSIFYHLKGYSVEQAFKIGEQIAKDMTKKFPYPVELKFEKVYDGLVLVSKKRYYGKCFDKLNGNAKYEGKGLECVRRDGIDLTSELMRDTLNLLLDTKDLSKVKDLLLDVLADSRAGLLTEDKYCFAKEVKMLKYSESSMPSHGHAARQLTRLDPNLIPKYGERMKYLVTKG